MTVRRPLGRLILLSVITAVAGNAIRAGVVTAPSAESGELNVSVDPRIELLSVVQLLSGYVMGASLVNTDATTYRRDLDVYFAPFRGHRAVTLFAEMYPKGFAFDVPPNVMLYFSNPPRLTQLQALPDDLKKRAGGERQLNEFIDALRDFARVSRFMEFYRAHVRTYQRIVDNTRATAKGKHLVGVLESYLGMKQHSYNVFLMPLAIELGFGVNVKRSDGTLDIYQMIGRGSVNQGIPVFGAGGEFTLQHIVWHEFSHSFVNPLTAQHRAEVNKYQSLYQPIAMQMKQQAYADWEHAVNEHIIRALTSRLTSRETSPAVGAAELQEDKSSGFLYVDALAQRLREYENNRSKYATFADFYPQLLNVFAEAQATK